jgi:hypothetical protein
MLTCELNNNDNAEVSRNRPEDESGDTTPHNTTAMASEESMSPRLEESNEEEATNSSIEPALENEEEIMISSAAPATSASSPEQQEKLEVALRAMERMSGSLARTKQNSSKVEELMRQVGSLRRTNAVLSQVLLVLVLWLALATGAVMSFVTPESFEAWREGIAIQLIRRTPQTSLMSLHLRRSFGYLCERSFFEIPNTLLVALKHPVQLVLGALLAVPFAAALRAGVFPSLRRCDDFLLAGYVLLAANVLFLGDDFGLPIADLMAKVGGFLLMASAAVLALPFLIRTVHRPRPWSAYRAQILRRLREEGGEAQPAAPARAAAVPAVAVPSLPKRAWLAFAASQLHRRHTATSQEISLVLLANTAVYAIDTLIAHD